MSKAFTHILESALDDAEACAPGVVFAIRDGNQFWFVLPDGVLPEDPPSAWGGFTDSHSCYAHLLARLLFERAGGEVCAYPMGARLLLDFDPLSLPSRPRSVAANSVGRWGQCVPTSPSAPINDLGPLLTDLDQTRKTLKTIGALLADPARMGDREVQDAMIASRDRALLKMAELSEVLLKNDTQSSDVWKDAVQQALTTALEAMVVLDEMDPEKKAGKQDELLLLQQRVQAYFGSANTQQACRALAAGINGLLLGCRKDQLEAHRDYVGQKVEKTYTDLMKAVGLALQNGVNLFELARPLLTPHCSKAGSLAAFARLRFSMAQILLAVQHGGLAMDMRMESRALSTSWIAKNVYQAPRVHIASHRAFQVAERRMSGASMRMALG